MKNKEIIKENKNQKFKNENNSTPINENNSSNINLIDYDWLLNLNWIDNSGLNKWPSSYEARLSFDYLGNGSSQFFLDEVFKNSPEITNIRVLNGTNWELTIYYEPTYLKFVMNFNVFNRPDVFFKDEILNKSPYDLRGQIDVLNYNINEHNTRLR